MQIGNSNQLLLQSFIIMGGRLEIDIVDPLICVSIGLEWLLHLYASYSIDSHHKESLQYHFQQDSLSTCSYQPPRSLRNTSFESCNVASKRMKQLVWRYLRHWTSTLQFHKQRSSAKQATILTQETVTEVTEIQGSTFQYQTVMVKNTNTSSKQHS